MMYIDLLEKVLTDFHRIEKGEHRPITWGKSGWKQRLLFPLDNLLSTKDYRVCKYIHPDIRKRTEGADWPFAAETMIGLKRLRNIRRCIEEIIDKNVKGDLIETGVWRGGATIYMRAILKAYNIKDRCVWVADSFEGLPKPDADLYEQDRGDTHYQQNILQVSLEDVKHNFAKFDLLDGQVKFLKGWFKDTLPAAPIERLSVLRLDGDMYQSTMDALVHLYPKLSIGGFLIVDDWGAVPACRQAVLDYRARCGIDEEIIPIDWSGVYWMRKS